MKLLYIELAIGNHHSILEEGVSFREIYKNIFYSQVFVVFTPNSFTIEDNLRYWPLVVKDISNFSLLENNGGVLYSFHILDSLEGSISI